MMHREAPGLPEAAAATRVKDYCGRSTSMVSQALEKQFVDAHFLADATKLFAHPDEHVNRDELLRMRVLECLLHACDLDHALGLRPGMPNDVLLALAGRKSSHDRGGPNGSVLA